jgi:glycosyltransferase involved in cell wall biosynthesis
VGTVTRMALAKAPLDFVAVGERLLAAHPEVVVLMIGDGPLMPEVQRRVEELGSARLRLLGLRHDVPELMAALDVFVLASRSEGSPLVLREAMALRKAIVATDVGGVSESVEDGATGFIVPAGDVEALARRTLELVRDPARAERLGESGHARVRPRFCPDWVAGRLGQLYRECLETTEARGKT